MAWYHLLYNVKPGAAAKPPLAVDLDGTLIRGDLFLESMLRFGFARPWQLPLLLVWLMRGRAHAKRRLAEQFPVTAADLPYDERILAWLGEERAQGRTIVLATASDSRAAAAVAEHLGLFDQVFASDGRVNLKAARKAERLAEAFPAGFSYAGNESADLKVWRAASQAVVVNASDSVVRRAEAVCALEATFERRGGALRAFVKAIRPQQWAKNLLVFVPMLVGQGWSDPGAWGQALIAFWALSLTASSVYLINDAADIDADRRHPRKKSRPFASGALSPAIGLAAALVLLGGGLALGAASGALLLLLVYLGATTLYTFWLKRIVLVDVFVLSALYTIRVILGGLATGYLASDWLLAFSSFFFLGLALVKRAVEVDGLHARGGGEIGRRGYFSTDGMILKMMGVAAGFVAALVLALYIQAPENQAHYHEPFLLWALPGAVVFWTCRLWLMADRGEMHDDPLIFAFRDKTSLALALLTAIAFAAAVLAPPNFLPW